MVYESSYPTGAIVGTNYQRPLIRRTARVRDNVKDHKDKYILEIHEYQADYQHNRMVPFVTVRDLKSLVAQGKQQSVSIPVPLCQTILDVFLKSRGEDGRYDPDSIEYQSFRCDVTKRVIEIEKVGESKRLRSYMEFPGKGYGQEEETLEVAELRKELMPQLVRFMGDVITRYREIKGEMHVPSLYSASGERRFFFDLRDTRWGKRLHVSQVTEYHRNVIGIPLDSLVSFRDRLNRAIAFLRLESGSRKSGSTGARNLTSERSESSDSDKAPDSEKIFSEDDDESTSKDDVSNAQTQTGEEEEED